MESHSFLVQSKLCSTVDKTRCVLSYTYVLDLSLKMATSSRAAALFPYI